MRTSTETMRLSARQRSAMRSANVSTQIDVPGGDDRLHRVDEIVVGRHLVHVVALRRHAAGDRRLDREAHLLRDALLLVVDADVAIGQHQVAHENAVAPDRGRRVARQMVCLPLMPTSSVAVPRHAARPAAPGYRTSGMARRTARTASGRWRARCARPDGTAPPRKPRTSGANRSSAAHARRAAIRRGRRTCRRPAVAATNACSVSSDDDVRQRAALLVGRVEHEAGKARARACPDEVEIGARIGEQHADEQHLAERRALPSRFERRPRVPTRE